MSRAWEQGYTVISIIVSFPVSDLQHLLGRHLVMRLKSQPGVKTLMIEIDTTLMELFLFFSVEVTTCKENLLKLIECKQEQFVEGIS